ncbi:L,D-transpeptidase family protein [Rickettsiella endosymbiont of Dermanyssus gallinae]|uniref:L,D-transpeptidase family protein n=1 Tax=Rickettsiella endosymbiont of Dermanyssus gallinae TaxID=2856608 RepID=UPI001C5285D3|nr:L,D-transpeptidase family protein [Rickettsiella endosymbiont of Dermanyssus gallinae]
MQYFKHYSLRLAGGFFFYLMFVTQAFALTFVLPPHGDSVVGHVQWTQALPGDTFSKIGRRYDMGYFELVEANPTIDPVHLAPGTIVVIPSRFILPAGPRQGIVINLAELRIYYYPPHRHVVITYPVGIGREGWDTPLGPSWIAQKISNPTWFVPESIRKDRAKDGVHLPLKVPPGPDNPLGGYAMRLKQLTFLIHGTNDYEGVGRRSSAGCLRLLPEDIESLYPQVKRKERVYIVDSPYKVGWDKDRLYLEAHVPLQGRSALRLTQQRATMEKLMEVNSDKAANIQWQSVDKIALRQNGIPQIIGMPKDALKAASHHSS